MGFDNIGRQITGDDEFGEDEIGLNHPFTPAHVRLKDNGNVEIMMNDSVGMIFNAQKNSLTIIADSIKFMTRHEEGLRWNNLTFNENATGFAEPTFLPFDNSKTSIYRGIDYFTKDD